MIQCANCNSEISEDRDFCPNCATALQKFNQLSTAPASEPGALDSSIANKLDRIIAQNDELARLAAKYDEKWLELVDKIMPMLERLGMIGITTVPLDISQKE